jgi:hypothetical protein
MIIGRYANWKKLQILTNKEINKDWFSIKVFLGPVKLWEGKPQSSEVFLDKGN